MEKEPHLEPEARRPLEEQVVRGESGATPFVVIGSLAATIWTVVAVVAGGALLLWWLL